MACICDTPHAAYPGLNATLLSNKSLSIIILIKTFDLIPNMSIFDGRVQFPFSVDKKAMNRNRYNRIPHPALKFKRERETYKKDGTKIKQHK